MNLRKPTSAVRDATALRPIREQNEMSPVGKNGCGGGSTGTALSRTRRRPAVGSTIPSVRWGAITSSNHVSWKESGRSLPPVQQARNSGTRPRFILASVKFLSRALTALNFDNVIDRGAEAAAVRGVVLDTPAGNAAPRAAPAHL
jgi:hypothetical protein